MKLLANLITGKGFGFDYIEQQGVAVFENIKKMNLEGIIAKRKDSKYIQGTRSKDCSKSKTQKHKIV